MSFSFCRVFVLCCIMFPVLDTGVLLWRSGWGHWGCDCFTQPPRWPLIFNQWDVEMLNSDYFHSQYCLLFKTFTNTYLVNMLKSVPAMCIQKQALPPPKKTFHSVPTITFTWEHSFAHSLWTHALTWDQVFHPLWLPISFLLFFFSFSIGYSDRDLRAWPEPWGPLLLALCLPPGAAKYRGAAVILPDKRANIPCSPLMSPAKRTGSTLGPLGLIYPFFLLLQRVDWGVKFVRCLSCDRLTTSHSHTALQIPKEPHAALSWFTLSGFMLHATEALCLRKISGANEPVTTCRLSRRNPRREYGLTTVVWLKLKGRISPFKHKKGIPVVLEILSSTFRIETAR